MREIELIENGIVYGTAEVIKVEKVITGDYALCYGDCWDDDYSPSVKKVNIEKTKEFEDEKGKYYIVHNFKLKDEYKLKSLKTRIWCLNNVMELCYFKEIGGGTVEIIVTDPRRLDGSNDDVLSIISEIYKTLNHKGIELLNSVNEESLIKISQILERYIVKKAEVKRHMGLDDEYVSHNDYVFAIVIGDNDNNRLRYIAVDECTHSELNLNEKYILKLVKSILPFLYNYDRHSECYTDFYENKYMSKFEFDFIRRLLNSRLGYIEMCFGNYIRQHKEDIKTMVIEKDPLKLD